MNENTLVNLERKLLSLLKPNETFNAVMKDNVCVLFGSDTGYQPRYTLDDALAFDLMCQYSCTPDRSSSLLAYSIGWACVPGTNARVNLYDFKDVKSAYRVVIVMAVIEKLTKNLNELNDE